MTSKLGSCLINGQLYYEYSYICTAKVVNYADMHTYKPVLCVTV
jgi:hypothetical protein